MAAIATRASKLLLIMRRIRLDASGLPTEPELRQALHTALSELEEGALADGLAERDVKDARYALAAGIDEALQFSNWPGRTGWSLHPLQVELFDDRNAGVGFFQRLAAVQKRGSPVLELYYWVLGLGFRGHYHTEESDEAQRLLDQLSSTVTSPESGTMSPQAVPPAPARPSSGPAKWILLGAVVVAALVFLSLSISLWLGTGAIGVAIQKAL